MVEVEGQEVEMISSTLLSSQLRSRMAVQLGFSLSFKSFYPRSEESFSFKGRVNC